MISISCLSNGFFRSTVVTDQSVYVELYIYAKYYLAPVIYFSMGVRASKFRHSDKCTSLQRLEPKTLHK